MAFSNRLKEARLKKGYTQEQIAEKIGIAKSTYTGYEKGNREPNVNTIGRLMEEFGVDANFLWQDDMTFPFELTYDEMEHLVKKYRALDDTGRTNVDIALDRETDRVQVLEFYKSRLVIESTKSDPTATSRRLQAYYLYLQKIACAGTSFTFDEIPTNTIEAPYVTNADFIIGVNGDSMEPDFQDGDKVYVQKTDSLSIGDIGIFTINDTCFIKELGEDGLISHNKNYENIPGNEDVRLIGKVIGKVV